MSDGVGVPRATLNLLRGSLVVTLPSELGTEVLDLFREDVLQALRRSGARQLVLDCSGIAILDAEDFERDPAGRGDGGLDGGGGVAGGAPAGGGLGPGRAGRGRRRPWRRLESRRRLASATDPTEESIDASGSDPPTDAAAPEAL